jgi:hypothetical protein
VRQPYSQPTLARAVYACFTTSESMSLRRTPFIVCAAVCARGPSWAVLGYTLRTVETKFQWRHALSSTAVGMACVISSDASASPICIATNHAEARAHQELRSPTQGRACNTMLGPNLSSGP